MYNDVRSAWERIPNSVKCLNVGALTKVGIHSHAERGSEKNSCIARSVRRAHGARYGFSMPNDLVSLSFYRTLLMFLSGSEKNTCSANAAKYYNLATCV